MTYSKSRTAILVCAWVIVGVFAFSAYGAPNVDLPSEVPGIETEVPSADAAAVGTTCNSGGNQGPPCMFPVERHTGGIVLGVAKLTGEQATAFGVGGGANGNIGTIYSPLAPERKSGQTQNGVQVDETISVGLNELNADKFFLYKSWKYDRTASPSVTDADVNVWVTADSATLTTEGNNDGCGDGSAGFDGSRNCDLLLNTGELSAGFFAASLEVSGFGELGAPRDELSASGFWIDDPEQDDCPILSGFPNPFNPLGAASLCLGLIEDGGISTTSLLDGANVELFNFMIRTHYAKAVRENGKNKLFSLNNGYLEIRHGKGADRSRVFPQGDNTIAGTSADNGNAQFRADNWQKPVTYSANDLTRRHGVGQGFVCDGGPDGDQDCEPDQDQSGSRTGGTESDGGYDDIHR